MDIKQYLSTEYLFGVNIAYISPATKLFLISGIVLLLLAIVMKIAAKFSPAPVDGKYRQKFYYLFLTIGISQVIWYGCRYQHITFFGSVFVAGVIVLIGLIWLATILVSAFKHYRTEKGTWEKEQVKLRYLSK